MSMMAENYASNARAEQVERTMVITYDLSKTANVRLLVATNMSNDFKEVKKVSGAVGKNVQAGANRQITWNVLEEYDSFVADGVRFKVETFDEGGFSVSSSKKVMFSKGNLQYHPANKLWRFAENQTDYIGASNSNCSSTYNGWLDLFGWSTSAKKFGVSTSTSNSGYSGSFVDWGRNKIGDDAPNTWRTLTYDEWNYLLKSRPNASSLKGVAEVKGVNGLILLPDNWECPTGIIFKSGFYYGDNFSYSEYCAKQKFTAAQWSKLESAGAVFLPISGNRYGANVYSLQYYGYYWSATERDSSYAYYLYFHAVGAYVNYYSRNRGHSVRLVKDL
jgi:uncharacterized protein (TIGR02145 family)